MTVTGESLGVDDSGGITLPLRLSSTTHRRLIAWCRETARLLDTTGVARGEVIEALIDQLLSDPNTSRAVRRRLAQDI
jgi:hypothetical protein